jgi:hypothetical protein
MQQKTERNSNTKKNKMTKNKLTETETKDEQTPNQKSKVLHYNKHKNENEIQNSEL